MTTIVFISVLSQSSANESDVPQQLRAWPSDGERPNNPSQALEANARLAFYCQSVSLNNIQTVRTASPQTAHYFQTKFFCCFCFSFLFISFFPTAKFQCSYSRLLHRHLQFVYICSPVEPHQRDHVGCCSASSGMVILEYAVVCYFQMLFEIREEQLFIFSVRAWHNPISQSVRILGRNQRHYQYIWSCIQDLTSSWFEVSFATG